MSNPGCIAPFLPFSLPPFESQSSRLLAFGVDARILNLRLITVFTSYSPARTLPSVVERKLQLLPQLLLEEEEKMLLLLLHQLPRPPARPPAGALPAPWYVAFGGGVAASGPPLPLRSIFLSPREVNATCRCRIRLRDNKSIFQRNWQLAISHFRSLTAPPRIPRP